MKPHITNRLILLISALVFSTPVFGSEPRSDYLYPSATDIPAAWVCLTVFLLTAMTYISSMRAVGVFEKLRAWLVGLGLGTVIMALGKDEPEFVAIGCVNIVVAANSGGAFCPRLPVLLYPSLS